MKKAGKDLNKAMERVKKRLNIAWDNMEFIFSLLCDENNLTREMFDEEHRNERIEHILGNMEALEYAARVIREELEDDD